MPKSTDFILSNKVASVKFLQLVVAGKTREAYSSLVSRDMRHHNIAFAGDAESLESAMRENNAQFPQKVLEVKHVIEEGSLVAVHSHIRMKREEPGYATVHIFRFEDNLIAEMWDIVQAVPENSPNKNGMF